jgi:hypothetical protein
MGWSQEWPMTEIRQFKDNRCVGISWGKPIVNEILVFECNQCLKELNINTTSFSKLMAAAKAQNWLVKFNDIGYSVHCDRCKG